MHINSVAFFGCLCGNEGDPHYDGAKATAKLVALSKRRVVNGGGPGTMLAATLGAKEGHGKTTVVYYKPKYATNFEGAVAENIADQTFEESNYITRTKKMLEIADAYIIFNGGTGTISELGMAWGIARLYFGHSKPLILFGDFWHHIMREFKRHMLVREDEYKVFKIVNTPEDALKAIVDFENNFKIHEHNHDNNMNDEKGLYL